jgi:hypothetical protein
MSAKNCSKLDRRVAKAFEFPAQEGWFTTTMQPGDRSILSLAPRYGAADARKRPWNGVHVRLTGNMLRAYCSGRRPRILQPTFNVLRQSPVRIAETLVRIAEAHARAEGDSLGP